jgi:hypothetical protein
MAKQTLHETDESLDGSLIFFYAKSGQSYEAQRCDILQFIEEHSMNTYEGGSGLTSDPYAREETVYIDSEDYYTENFYEVNNQYFKYVINV